MRVVLDAGPVIHLSWIDGLDLLQDLCTEVLVPPAVRDEVLAAPAETPGLDRIQAAVAGSTLKVVSVEGAGRPDPIPPGSADAGEIAAIYLAEDINADLFITDDAAARKIALRRGLRVTGTLGVLKAARQSGLIPSVLPLLIELRRQGQWISEQLVQEVRREEGA